MIDRPPSAELRENQKDQDSLPPYDVLDASGQTLDQSRLINADGTGFMSNADAAG